MPLISDLQPEIEYGAFQLQNVTSGGNIFSEFPENQVTEFRAV